MSEHPLLSQYTVEGRLRSQVLAPVRKLRDDLFRGRIPELFAVGSLHDLFSFGLAETMSGWLVRAVAAVFPSRLLSPPDDGPGTQSEDIRCRLKPRSGGNGLVNEPEHYCPFLWGVLSSSSPQIAWAFFFRNSKAAASAKAFSLRASSCFSSLTSLVCRFLFVPFFKEALP